MSVGCGQGSKGRSAAGGAATVKWGSAAGEAAVLDYITAGGAVGVNYSAAGGSSRSRLAAGRAARVSQLLIKQLGSIVIAVRCQRRVVRAAVYCWQQGRVLGSKALPSPVLGRSYRHNSNWDRRHIGTISWSIDRLHISTIIVCP